MIPVSTQRAVKALCTRHQAVILAFTVEQLHIAVANNPDPALTEALRFTTPTPLKVECWPQAQLDRYRQQQISAPDAKPEAASDAPEKIQALLQLAVQRRASDIHIEPQSSSLRIRLRIDGILQCVPGYENSQPAALIARLKILASLDITERRTPQDGQFTTEIDGKPASFRLSTLPTCHGEKAAIRLLQSQSQPIVLEKLGMPAASLRLYRQALTKPQGLILVTGPTGSGKTFTLYSGLNSLNSAERNLCSVEDPVEIPLPGVNQTQIHPKAGLDFNRVLRALLRQDPDVIMLGEIRDRETAEAAIKAAQTGHRVLSTLHTNSTTETLTRLSQIGIPGYQIASALVLIVAQRLVRRLCPWCRTPGKALAHLPGAIWPGTLQNWQAVGCEHCYSGFFGRLALFEMLPITSRLQNAIAADSSAERLAEIARQQGRNTLFVEGLHCVNRGDTTLEELYRIVGSTG